MRDRHEGVDRVELTALIFGVVHAVSSQAHLETQILIITQVTHDATDVLTRDEDAEFAVFNDDLFNDIRNCQTIGSNQFLEDVNDLIEVGTIGALRCRRSTSNGDLLREARGITLIRSSEQTLTGFDDLGLLGTETINFFAHASSPFKS